MPYRGGGAGKVLVTNGRSPGGTESTYPIYSQDEKTAAVFSHRVDGTIGIPGGSPFDILLSPEEIRVKVRAYRDAAGALHVVCGANGAPDTPFPTIAEGECTIKL